MRISEPSNVNETSPRRTETSVASVSAPAALTVTPLLATTNTGASVSPGSTGVSPSSTAFQEPYGSLIAARSPTQGMRWPSGRRSTPVRVSPSKTMVAMTVVFSSGMSTR